MTVIDRAYNAFINLDSIDGRVDIVRNGKWYYRRELIAVVINSHNEYFNSVKKFAELAFNRVLNDTHVFICINASSVKKSLLDRVNRILPARYGQYCECMSSFDREVKKGVFIKDTLTNTIARRVLATEKTGAYLGFTNSDFVGLLNHIKAGISN